MGRRTRHEEPENHERWLVSYADFITLLFAFFVVMYAISTLNEGKYRSISDALLQAFHRDRVATAQSTGLAPINRTTSFVPAPPAQRPVDLLRKRDEERKMQGLANRIRDALHKLVASGQVRLTQLPHGIAVEINASLLFAPGQASLEPDSIAALTALAGTLADGDYQIRVEGHTDNIPIASALYPSNWELSSARASSVVRLFVSASVPAGRLCAIGYAEHRPVESNDTVEGRARNRRVALIILDDLTSRGEEIPPLTTTAARS
jgi:chemotaxis protein MotB